MTVRTKLGGWKCTLQNRTVLWIFCQAIMPKWTAKSIRYWKLKLCSLWKALYQFWPKCIYYSLSNHRITSHEPRAHVYGYIVIVYQWNCHMSRIMVLCVWI